MKRIVKLIIILSLFAQAGNAQKIETEEGYKARYDSIVPQLKLTEKEANSCIDKPFSEFVKLLGKYNAKVIYTYFIYDDDRVYPQHVFGLHIYFTTIEDGLFARNNRLRIPAVIVYFKESKPYEKALSFLRKNGTLFTEEVEEFYSDAVIKSIAFYNLDGYNKKR